MFRKLAIMQYVSIVLDINASPVRTFFPRTEQGVRDVFVGSRQRVTRWNAVMVECLRLLLLEKCQSFNSIVTRESKSV